MKITYLILPSPVLSSLAQLKLLWDPPKSGCDSPVRPDPQFENHHSERYVPLVKKNYSSVICCKESSSNSKLLLTWYSLCLHINLVDFVSTFKEKKLGGNSYPILILASPPGPLTYLNNAANSSVDKIILIKSSVSQCFSEHFLSSLPTEKIELLLFYKMSLLLTFFLFRFKRQKQRRTLNNAKQIVFLFL